MSVGAVIAFVQLSKYVLNPVIVVGNYLPKIRAARAVIERDEALVAARVGVTGGSAFPEGFDGAVSVCDLTFSYPGAAEPALRAVSAEFAPGRAYALVGASGSGKSTLLRVLAGSLAAPAGAVAFDGVDLASIDLARLPELYALISQEVFLFDASVRENVTLFGDVPDAAVTEACRRAGLGTLVAEKGIDYACGEGGRNLSGGERQRVAIARALRREAPLLLVDEATAALDQRTATAVENTILDVPGATKVVITHRLSEPELRRYDQICVMDGGQIVEHGSFEVLLAQGGAFARLFSGRA